MHIEWQQLGNTILVQGSKQIPHSSSLSKSMSENFLLSSGFFLAVNSKLLLAFAPSSSSVSRWRYGRMIAADSFFKERINNAHL